MRVYRSGLHVATAAARGTREALSPEPHDQGIDELNFVQKR